ncbi:CinA family protein [Williamsia sp. M5A3_1d]
MTVDPDDRLPTDDDIGDLCEEIASLADEGRMTIATAESLTAGNIATHLGRATSSGDWYRGGVIAYRAEVKHSLLKVPDGPVVTEPAARAMARTTAELFGADIAVAVTGEGGPQTQEDVPAGTVCFGLFDRGSVHTAQRVFEGDPPDVLAATVDAGLHFLLDHLRDATSTTDAGSRP